MPSHRSAVLPSRRGLIRGIAAGSATALVSAGTTGAAQAAPGPAPAPAHRKGRVREYWIAAESFPHNAVPNGRDEMSGATFTAAQTSFTALGFRAYTPGWGRPLPADLGPHGIGANTGIPGPVIRAQVGDTLKVHFRNDDHHYRWPHSMHPHGVRYTPDNDGGWVAASPDTPGTAVPYGGTYTYTWTAEPSSVGTWPYHDHSVPQTVPGASSGGGMGAMGGGTMEIGAQLGLVGVLVVTDHHTPDVDREFALVFHDLYANDVPSLAQDLDLFNGYAFLGNTPTFHARAGERVRWRIVALGKEFHVFHLHGHRWRSGLGYQGWVDSQIVGPSTSLTVEYTEDNPGDWLYHCHVVDHMMGGMVGRYTVSG
ncbi:multicopper oxidase domain-containing protein [Streptacidiphilus monticola]|jgi:FtsP/CotA-like multicopper oxidase with cupredoxin domain|uniref:Multicopper oxidase domain-containing protein n=1 Tax=Streptacidiphilus monticola TaxID=2161674 RepID=A0ABW1G2X4_9ACTN